MHQTDTASAWILRWTHLVAPGASVLDVAGGFGRHSRWFAQRGHPVTLVDRSPEALSHVRATLPSVRVIDADIENGPWPLHGERFGAVVVTHYLWRALMPEILASLADGGVLLYETFSEDNGSVGKPSRSEFLLRHGELLEFCAGLRIVAYEDGFLEEPPRYLQRVAAVRLAPDSAAPRHLLSIPHNPAG